MAGWFNSLACWLEVGSGRDRTEQGGKTNRIEVGALKTTPSHKAVHSVS